MDLLRMFLIKFLHWLYCLDISEICLFCVVAGLMVGYLHRRLRSARWYCAGLIAVLAVWAGAALWSTIRNRSGGTMDSLQLMPFHSYREVLAGGNREILRSNFMNVVLFYPAGLLFAAILPERWRIVRRTAAAVAVFALFSLLIESLQFCCGLGRGEIDDVIHNTLGAVCGCLAFSFGPKLFPTDKKEKTSMSKILILTNHSYMLYRFRTELIRELMKDHEVVLSMPFVGHEEDFQAMGLRCIETELDRRGIDPKRDLKLFAFYRSLLQAEKPDMVITYSIKPNIYGGWACQMAGIPYCANVQGLGTAFQKKGLAQVVTMMYKTALRKAKTVFFENQGNANEFLDRHITPAKKITVLNGAGINLEAYPAVPYPENDRFHFLYLSRLMAEKGVIELLTAMERLSAELGDRVVLDLVGFYDDEACQAKAEELVEKGIAVFHGFQPEPRPFYAAADCVVLASYHEGMSNVLLEAAATTRPVITSDIYGCREAVDEGVTGLLCRVRDADSLYEQMKKMALLSREERAQMGIAGRAKMERQFDKKVVVQNTLDAVFSPVR